MEKISAQLDQEEEEVVIRSLLNQLNKYLPTTQYQVVCSIV